MYNFLLDKIEKKCWPEESSAERAFEDEIDHSGNDSDGGEQTSLLNPHPSISATATVEKKSDPHVVAPVPIATSSSSQVPAPKYGSTLVWSWLHSSLFSVSTYHRFLSDFRCFVASRWGPDHIERNTTHLSGSGSGVGWAPIMREKKAKKKLGRKHSAESKKPLIRKRVLSSRVDASEGQPIYTTI